MRELPIDDVLLALCGMRCLRFDHLLLHMARRWECGLLRLGQASKQEEGV